jgi:hypothetical protein
VLAAAGREGLELLVRGLRLMKKFGPERNGSEFIPSTAKPPRSPLLLCFSSPIPPACDSAARNALSKIQNIYSIYDCKMFKYFDVGRT